MRHVERNIHRTAALLGLSAAFLVAFALASSWLSVRQQATFETLLRDRELRRAASDLRTALYEAEIGQLGFLLTGDPALLVPYDDAVGTLPALQSDLARRAAGSKADTDEALDGLDALVRERVALARRSVEARIAGQEPDPAALLAGKAAMDEIGLRLGGLLDRTAIDFQGLLEAQVRLNRWSVASGLVALGATIVVAALALVGAARQVRALAAAEVEVRHLNAELEERVRSRTQALEAANEEVRRFAYVVSHDLRVPLVNVMGFAGELEESLRAVRTCLQPGREPTEAELTEARQAVDRDAPEALGFIRSSTRRMDGLINAILRISRDGRRELHPENLDLAALAHQALDAVAHKVGEAGGEAGVDVRGVDLVSDRLSVEQVLSNLVDNAVKYARPGHPLRLTVRARPEGNAHVRIEVEDNGRGIAPADHERVFDLFRRAGRPAVAGEGIGLAHVRTLVRSLGGEVTLRSREGEGSVFAVVLPARLPGTQPPSEAA